MKIVFGILLFTFVVFFNSIEVSSQSSSGAGGVGGGGGAGGGFPYLIKIPHPNWEVGNQPRGHRFVLPNGNVYVSTGTGSIYMEYNVAAGTVYVEQRGSHPVILNRGVFLPSTYEASPNVTIIKLQNNSRPPVRD